MKYIFFTFLTAMACSACQSSNPEPKRTLECYVRFLETEGAIHAEATLREGDTLQQPVEVPGGFSYQGKAMKLRSLPAITYVDDHGGGFDLKHRFDWKDAKNQEHTFEMEMSPISEFGFGAPAISRSKPQTFRWKGAPLDKGEALVFMWENSALGQTVPMNVINSTQSQVDFPAAKLAELAPGQWTLYLVRKKLTKADAGGVAASGIIEYYTRTDSIEVGE